MSSSAALRFHMIIVNMSHEMVMNETVLKNTKFPSKAKERCPKMWTPTCPFLDVFDRNVETHSTSMNSLCYWNRCPLRWDCSFKPDHFLGNITRQFTDITGKQYCHQH